MQGLELTDQVIDGVVVISVGGSLDSTNASQLKEMMDHHLAEGRSRFLLDYREIEYISSAGWGILLGRLKKIKERSGELIIAGMTNAIESIYKMLELDRVITALPTIDEAAEHYAIEIPLVEKHIVEEKKTIFDAIVEVIGNEPLIGFFKLREKLTSPPYNHQFNIFQFFWLLRKHGLETKLKRVYYLYQQLLKEK